MSSLHGLGCSDPTANRAGTKKNQDFIPLTRILSSSLCDSHSRRCSLRVLLRQENTGSTAGFGSGQSVPEPGIPREFWRCLWWAQDRARGAANSGRKLGRDKGETGEETWGKPWGEGRSDGSREERRRELWQCLTNPRMVNLRHPGLRHGNLSPKPSNLLPRLDLPGAGRVGQEFLNNS